MVHWEGPLTSTSPVDPRTSTLEALLAEYNSLRNESLRTIDNRIIVLNFTFGALSIVIAGLLTRSVPDPLSGVIGLFLVPQTAKAGLLIWLGEYQRSLRAGRWLCTVEGKINSLIGKPNTIGWETALSARMKNTPERLGYPYLATVFFCLVAGYAGTLIGATLLLLSLVNHVSTFTFALCATTIVVYALSIEGYFLQFIRRKWRMMRSM